MDNSDIVGLLRAEGIDVTEIGTGEPRFWVGKFTIEENTWPAFLFLPPDSEYYTAFSPVIGEAFEKLISDQPSEFLVKLFRISSDAPLAKIEYMETNGKAVYCATSACAVSGASGKKLRRRMEACVKLASDLRGAFGQGGTAKQA
jgi:hypothetical protein